MMPTLPSRADLLVVEGHTRRLRTYVEAADYAGYDPFDALNSPLIRLIRARSKWAGIAATQILRRCPLNVRPLLGIQPGHNPKALGLFLWGYARLFALEQDSAHLGAIDYLLRLLDGLKSGGYSGNCWGYNFDWQNRTMWTPRYTPTIVNSAFIGHALLDTYFLGHVDRALDMAVGIKDFICNDLKRHEEEDRLCFSYTPLDDAAYVHNANLLGASLLIRLYPICGDRALEQLALASLRYALHHQRPDGAWYYAQINPGRYVDSFHTGFNLQALQYFLRAGYGPCCRQPYQRGLRYYVDQFFLRDGAAKYYDHKVFPIDIHSLSQAVVVLSDLHAGQAEVAERVLHWMLQHMWSSKGYFYFRKGRFHTNKIPYMRWSQAWAFHALTSYLYNQSPEGAGELA
jgi:hypothetical protein